MRLLLIVALLAFVPVCALAQTSPQSLTIPHVYPTPPASLTTPQVWNLDGVLAIRGNLGRWRDSERTRIGPYEVDPTTGVGRNLIGEVGGYFAYFGDGVQPGGIVESTWRQPSAGVGQSGALRPRYIRPRSICDATLERAVTDIAELTYLGPEWLPEFDALDAALATAAPSATGRQLTEGETVRFASSPDLSRYYPQRALEREAQGLVEISCIVRADFRVVCGTISETPPGWGFGEATQRAMRSMRVQETTSNGEPSSGVCFQQRIRWMTG